ncbi:hypothetical protein I302_108417 [Kwoniella bestiolae CBS 10118]|uniref:A to I editase domain-containing protein n=1 Tax=Kwoniella bestiolae CBS 10118 TaxID=1296100 RepID=A0A1B9FVR0_9TREE|nr:hypothetical protein I302_07208 [Kwoniella bestiolae CBS 10118]OCF22862.1 hypothetical protein I302_07208 [Kwoniella bestiolae CBS 10118]
MVDSLSLQDSIVESSHRLYSSLPAHGKPLIRSNGVQEWTILSTISLVIPGTSPKVFPISLGTGVKCLPYSKLSEYGDTLHDCHAEIIARRGFLRWLLWQTGIYLRSQRGETTGEDVFVEMNDQGKLKLRDGLEVWLYISMLPCGDASTYYTSAHQSAEDASQWQEADSTLTGSTDQGSIGVVRGRNGYTSLSTLRTKPGRPDSIPSISMSCSDKIASWSVLGIQGGLLANLFEPIYLDGIIVGGVEFPLTCSDEDEWESKIRGELERSLWGRLESIQGHLPSPYRLHRASVHLTPRPFEHSKTTIVKTSSVDTVEPSPSPLSISHLPFLPPSNPRKGIKPEIITDGGLLGHPWKKGVLTRDKGRSRICKLSLLKEYEKVLQSSPNGGTHKSIEDGGSTYYECKHLHQTSYQLAKKILRGIPTSSKSIKGLEKFEAILSTASSHTNGTDKSGTSPPPPLPPFRGWLVSGERFESVTSSGHIYIDRII